MNMARILVVTNDQDPQKHLRNFLESNGYIVETTGGGETCCIYYKQNQQDLVIIDLTIPEESEGETIIQLKEHHPYI
jgi:CheY-like chemotaxis protein